MKGATLLKSVLTCSSKPYYEKIFGSGNRDEVEIAYANQYDLEFLKKLKTLLDGYMGDVLQVAKMEKDCISCFEHSKIFILKVLRFYKDVEGYDNTATIAELKGALNKEQRRVQYVLILGANYTYDISKAEELGVNPDELRRYKEILSGYNNDSLEAIEKGLDLNLLEQYVGELGNNRKAMTRCQYAMILGANYIYDIHEAEKLGVDFNKLRRAKKILNDYNNDSLEALREGLDLDELEHFSQSLGNNREAIDATKRRRQYVEILGESNLDDIIKAESLNADPGKLKRAWSILNKSNSSALYVIELELNLDEIENFLGLLENHQEVIDAVTDGVRYPLVSYLLEHGENMTPGQAVKFAKTIQSVVAATFQKIQNSSK